MKPLLIILLEFLAFHVERIIFNFFQWIWWWCNGTHGQIQDAKDVKNYAKSARLSRVRKSLIFDNWFTYNSSMNLICSHERFVHPEYVLKDEVSLYCVTETEALFIEAPPGVEVWKSQYSAFHRIAQHEYAEKLISMPLSSFYRLAKELGEIKEELIFVDFVLRSGSTLFGQIFEETGVCVNYSEPSMLNMFMHDFDEDVFKKVVKACVRFYAKPRSSQTKAFVFKYIPMGRSIAPILHDVFPRAHFFHMTRNSIPNIKSIMKVTTVTPFGRMLRLCCSLPLVNYYFRLALLQSTAFDFDEKLRSILLPAKKSWYTEAIAWFGMHHLYVKWQKTAGFDMPSVKYEDLISNPRENVEMLFERCGLNLDLVDDALTAFTKDSQAGSPFDQNILKNFNPNDMIDSECLDFWQEVADYFGFHNWKSDFRLPGTVTKALQG